MPECINCHQNRNTYPTICATTNGVITAPVCKSCGLTNLDIPDFPGLYITLTRNFVLCLCCLHWSPIGEDVRVHGVPA